MWIINAGNRRTGSTVHYHLTREIVENQGLGKGFGAVPGGAIDRCPGWSFDKYRDYNGYKVFRTHRRTPEVVKLFRNETCKVIYIFRDVRDCVVSVMLSSHKNQTFKSRFPPGWFANFLSIDRIWTGYEDVYVGRYENLVENIKGEAYNIAKYLNITVSADFLLHLEEKYDRDNITQLSSNTKTHLSGDKLVVDIEGTNDWAVNEGGQLKPFLTNHVNTKEPWGVWQNHLTEYQVQYIEKYMSNWLKKKGYPLSTELRN